MGYEAEKDLFNTMMDAAHGIKGQWRPLLTRIGEDGFPPEIQLGDIAGAIETLHLLNRILLAI